MAKFQVASKHTELSGYGTKFLVTSEKANLKFNVHFLRGDAISVEYQDRKYNMFKQFGALPSVTTLSSQRFQNWFDSSDNTVLTSSMVTLQNALLHPGIVDLVDITFDCCGGSFDDSTSSKTLKFAPGYKFSEYEFPSNPSKTGVYFGGWYTQQGGAGDKITSSTLCPQSATTYYAYWRENMGVLLYCGNYPDYQQTDVELGTVIEGSLSEGYVVVQCNGSSYMNGYDEQMNVYFTGQYGSPGSFGSFNTYEENSFNWWGVENYGFDIYAKVVE